MRSPSRFLLGTSGLFVAGLTLLVTSGVAPRAVSGSDLVVPLDPPRGLYTIDCTVRFEPGAAVVSGVEEIVLINSSPQPLTRLAFDWSPGRRHAMEVSVGGIPAPLLSHGADAEESLVLVTLPESIGSGQELRVSVRFESTYTIEPEEKKHLWTLNILICMLIMNYITDFSRGLKLMKLRLLWKIAMVLGKNAMLRKVMKIL